MTWASPPPEAALVTTVRIMIPTMVSKMMKTPAVTMTTGVVTTVVTAVAGTTDRNANNRSSGQGRSGSKEGREPTFSV